MRATILLPACLVLLQACMNGPHAGYTRIAPDIHFRLITLGGGEAVPAQGDSVLLLLRAGVPGGASGELASVERWFAVADLRRGDWAPVLDRIHQGDSASVILPVTAMPWAVLLPSGAAPPANDLVMQVELAIREHLPAAHLRERATARRSTGAVQGERSALTAFIATSGQPWQRWGTSDLHYLLGPVPGDTARVRPGDRVLITYSGEHLDGGAPFDVREGEGRGLAYRFGEPDQVLAGINVAVSLLRDGQEGRFLIPSAMAFGAAGVHGHVRPHEPVVYRVRLVRVERTADPGT